MGIKDFLDRVDTILNDNAISDSLSHAAETINESLNKGIASLEDSLPADPTAAPCEQTDIPKKEALSIEENPSSEKSS